MTTGKYKVRDDVPNAKAPKESKQKGQLHYYTA